MKKKHWTEELFIDNADLFIMLFNEQPERMAADTSILLQSLKEQGYQPGRILDMNCGIGRHSVELGKRGIEVLGTDISPRYVEIAGEKAAAAGVTDKVRFVVADMRKIYTTLKGEKPFDGVINLWTSFGFYDDKTNDDILRQCLKLVRPGGFFAMDIVNRDWLVRFFAPRGLTRIGEDVIILEERNFNLNDSRMYNTWTFLKATARDNYRVLREVKLDHRVWSLHELIAMFERTGWGFKAACPGLTPVSTSQEVRQSSGGADLLRANRLLVIAGRPVEGKS